MQHIRAHFTGGKRIGVEKTEDTAFPCSPRVGEEFVVYHPLEVYKIDRVLHVPSQYVTHIYCSLVCVDIEVERSPLG